jgi:hypothetical protein
VSQGGANGGGLGASQITEDLVRMIAQAPALFETLTGQKMSELMARVPALAEFVPPTPPTNGTPSNGMPTNGAA